MKVGVSSHISKTLLNQIENADEYMMYARRSLSRELAGGILGRYEGSIEHTMLPQELSLELRLELHVFNQEELDAYVQQQIDKAIAAHDAHASQCHPPAIRR